MLMQVTSSSGKGQAPVVRVHLLGIMGWEAEHTNGVEQHVAHAVDRMPLSFSDQNIKTHCLHSPLLPITLHAAAACTSTTLGRRSSL